MSPRSWYSRSALTGTVVRRASSPTVMSVMALMLLLQLHGHRVEDDADCLANSATSAPSMSRAGRHDFTFSLAYCRPAVVGAGVAATARSWAPVRSPRNWSRWTRWSPPTRTPALTVADPMPPTQPDSTDD